MCAGSKHTTVGSSGQIALQGIPDPTLTCCTAELVVQLHCVRSDMTINFISEGVAGVN